MKVLVHDQVRGKKKMCPSLQIVDKPALENNLFMDIEGKLVALGSGLKWSARGNRAKG